MQISFSFGLPHLFKYGCTALVKVDQPRGRVKLHAVLLTLVQSCTLPQALSFQTTEPRRKGTTWQHYRFGYVEQQHCTCTTSICVLYFNERERERELGWRKAQSAKKQLQPLAPSIPLSILY